MSLSVQCGGNFLNFCSFQHSVARLKPFFNILFFVPIVSEVMLQWATADNEFFKFFLCTFDIGVGMMFSGLCCASCNHDPSKSPVYRKQRIPSRNNPPPMMSQWLTTFQVSNCVVREHFYSLCTATVSCLHAECLDGTTFLPWVRGKLVA